MAQQPLICIQDDYWAARRDFIREFVDACRRHGLRVGLYYSIMSWQFPACHCGPQKDPAGYTLQLDVQVTNTQGSPQTGELTLHTSRAVDPLHEQKPSMFGGIGNQANYVASIKETKDGFTTDGVIDADGAKNVIEVLAAAYDDLAKKKAQIDVAKGYTTQFVSAVPKA